MLECALYSRNGNRKLENLTRGEVWTVLFSPSYFFDFRLLTLDKIGSWMSSKLNILYITMGQLPPKSTFGCGVLNAVKTQGTPTLSSGGDPEDYIKRHCATYISL